MSNTLCQVFLYSIVVSMLSLILSQTVEQTPCEKASSAAKSYNDCKNYDNTIAETVCCYVQGTTNNTSETACLDVDVLFKGRTISYSGNGVSGQLICESISSSTNKHLLKTILIALIIILIY